MYKKLKSLSDKFNGNISFINQFKIEELIEISKLAAISSINFINYFLYRFGRNSRIYRH